MTEITPPSPEEFDMWVVYKYPRDFPDHYVARLWRAAPGFDAMSADRDQYVLADTLEELQEQLANAGRVCLERMPGDDPVIVETWI